MRTRIKDWLKLIAMSILAIVVLAAIVLPQFFLAYAKYEKGQLQDTNFIVCDSCGNHIAIAKL